MALLPRARSQCHPVNCPHVHWFLCFCLSLCFSLGLREPFQSGGQPSGVRCLHVNSGGEGSWSERAACRRCPGPHSSRSIREAARGLSLLPFAGSNSSDSRTCPRISCAKCHHAQCTPCDLPWLTKRAEIRGSCNKHLFVSWHSLPGTRGELEHAEESSRGGSYRHCKEKQGQTSRGGVSWRRHHLGAPAHHREEPFCCSTECINQHC